MKKVKTYLEALKLVIETQENNDIVEIELLHQYPNYYLFKVWYSNTENTETKIPKWKEGVK